MDLICSHPCGVKLPNIDFFPFVANILQRIHFNNSVFLGLPKHIIDNWPIGTPMGHYNVLENRDSNKHFLVAKWALNPLSPADVSIEDEKRT